MPKAQNFPFPPFPFPFPPTRAAGIAHPEAIRAAPLHARPDRRRRTAARARGRLAPPGGRPQEPRLRAPPACPAASTRTGQHGLRIRPCDDDDRRPCGAPPAAPSRAPPDAAVERGAARGGPAGRGFQEPRRCNSARCQFVAGPSAQPRAQARAARRCAAGKPRRALTPGRTAAGPSSREAAGCDCLSERTACGDPRLAFPQRPE